MNDRYLMALDAGSGAGRCLLVNLDGSKVFTCYHEWGYSTPPGAGPMAAEFNPEEFWEIISKVTREAVVKAGIRADQIAAVSSTSQREGIVLLDHAGKEIYAGPNRDYRAVFEGLQIANRFGSELYQRTGHYPGGIFAAARLMWFRSHNPSVIEQTAHLLSINDWVLYRLSGEYACEPTNAGETCLYDLTTGEWVEDVIRELELPLSIYPPVLPAGTQVGKVTKRAAAETGLTEGTPVVIGGADTQCGLLGSGAYHPNDIAAISGTTTPVQMVTAIPIIDPQERLWAGAHVVPGLFVLESNAGGSGSVYQWFRDTFCDHEVEQARITGKDPYDIINAHADRAPVGALGMQSFIGVMVMNAKSMGMPSNLLNLGMAPMANPNQSAKPFVVRALLESLAYAVKLNAQQIIDVSGSVPNCLFVCGGLSKSKLYLEALANTMSMPVQVPHCTEGTAIGAAICAGVGAGVYQGFEDGVNTLVHFEPEVEPDDRLSKQYRSAFKKWSRTRDTLASLSIS